MSWTRQWQIRYGRHKVEYGGRVTALRGAIRYANAHPGTVVEVWDLTQGKAKLYTRARVDA